MLWIPLRCPECHLQMKTFGLETEYRFDKCPQCNGMWFDLKELNSYIIHDNSFAVDYGSDELL